VRREKPLVFSGATPDRETHSLDHRFHCTQRPAGKTGNRL